MVAFAEREETDADRVAILLCALEHACAVIVADDILLRLYDPDYTGTPPCVAVWKKMVESMRSNCCRERTGGDA